MTLDPAPQGPSTHAFVVGVGNYPHLRGGDGAPATYNWKLKQLSSAPVSALHFIHWLLHGFNNPGKPLASIEHLISAPHQMPDRAGNLHASEAPTMQNIELAYGRWMARVGSNLDNLAIFYFCGHGLHNNSATAVLAEDFANPLFPRLSKNAIHVEKTVQGMLASGVKQQCYFIDSCRTTNERWQDMMDEPGQPLGTAVQGDVAPLEQPIFFAAGLDQVAVAPAGQPSLFTKALIDALDHLGAADPLGDHDQQAWVVDTGNLLVPINAAIRLEVAANPALEGQQCKLGGNSSGFELHYPKPPLKIPVEVTCSPKQFNLNAQFSILDSAGVPLAQQNFLADPWIQRLAVDDYQVKVTLNLQNGFTATRKLRLTPPGKRVPFVLPTPPPSPAPLAPPSIP